MTFEEWWRCVGSAFSVNPGEDYEEHAKRVSESAWNAARSTATRTDKAEDHLAQAAALGLAYMKEWSARMKAEGDKCWSEDHQKRTVYRTLSDMLMNAVFGDIDVYEKEKQS